MFAQKVDRFKELVRQFVHLVGSGNQTYYPDVPRKSKARICYENLLWVIRYHEINRYYYIYGLDRKDTPLSKVLPYRAFTKIRDSRNLKPADVNFNYASILRDKFLFGQFLSSLQAPTPVNTALIRDGNFTWLNTMKTSSLSDVVRDPQMNIDGFCKKLTGLQGKGAFPLRISGSKIFIGPAEISLPELMRTLTGVYLLQQRVEQHDALKRLYPHALNTMRIVTFNNHGSVEVFNAAMRIGTGNKHVDNWGAGGIAVGIDLDAGMLRQKGFYKPVYGRLVEVHPDTGVCLHGFAIPFFNESIELVKNVHRYLYGIHSIGWDVAVTPDGPIIIEANEDWDGSFAMAAEEQFKTRFLGMFSVNGASRERNSQVK